MADSRRLHEEFAFRDDRRADARCWTATSSRGMAATAHYLATAAGAEMLASGGNAIDAAVAASLTLGVCEPGGSGLGGMTVAMIHLAAPRRTFVLSGCCRAPARSTPEALRGRSRYRGHHAVAVPANAAVLHHALSRYGKLSHRAVFEPAIRFAEEGLPLTVVQEGLIRTYRRPLRKWGCAEVFFDEARAPRRRGAWMRPTALGRTLRRLSDAGFEDFYHGEISRRICADMNRHGGLLAAGDLAEFSEPVESEPLTASFGDSEVLTFGPPGGGVALVQMLNVFEQLTSSGLDPDSGEGAALVAETIRQSRLDRRRLKTGGEGTAVGEARQLIDEEYARQIAGRISSGGTEQSETSHLCAADSDGNWVSMTQSLERSFGAAVMTPELGFLYNGYMRTFKLRTPSHPHYLRPGGYARSNAVPTLLLRGGKPWAAIGNTGSERLASGIVQTLLRLERQSAFESVLAPRMHCTPEGTVLVEADRCSSAALEGLREKGFDIKTLDPFSFKVGGLQLVIQNGAEFTGVAEPRRDGAAGGPEGLSGWTG